MGSRLAVFPGERRPLLFAHRGLSSVEPENTLAAFRAARDAGVPGLELDVHLTRDGRLAVIHDDSPRRTTRVPGSGASEGPEGRIEDLEWSELAGLDTGSWKNPARSGERIPLLRELFEEIGDSVYYDIELKSRSASGGPLERAVARAIADAGLGGRCAISSFNPFAIRRFKECAPGIPTAIIWCRSKELHWFLRHGEGRWLGAADYLKPEHVLVRPFPGRARPATLRPVAAWTVDDPAEARRLVACGCEGIVSNAPDRLGL